METVQDLAHKKALVAKEYYKRNKVAWLTDCCKTFDEHDRETAVKPFPVKDYVKVLVEEYEKHDILHVAKSRQMTVSWLFMALFVHEAQFYPHRLIAVFSKKEDDAFQLVERAKFIYEEQPKWLKNLCPLDRKMRDMPLGHLFFANGSKTVGFAQGKDQVRSYVPSVGFIDEAAFQDKLEETYNACVPCCQKIITVSSANAGFFQKLCEL